jgi:hypothetical protein
MSHTSYFEFMDESEVKLRCFMTDLNRDYLPTSLCCGDVLCLKKITVELSGEKLLVNVSSATTWVLFRKQDDYRPSSTLTHFPVGPSERSRLSDLRKWTSEG